MKEKKNFQKQKKEVKENGFKRKISEIKRIANTCDFFNLLFTSCHFSSSCSCVRNHKRIWAG